MVSFCLYMAYISTEETSFPLKIRIQNVSNHSYFVHLMKYHLEMIFLIYYYGCKLYLLAIFPAFVFQQLDDWELSTDFTDVERRLRFHPPSTFAPVHCMVLPGPRGRRLVTIPATFQPAYSKALSTDWFHHLILSTLIYWYSRRR